MPAGTLTLTNDSNLVSGTGTAFDTETNAGDYIVCVVGKINLHCSMSAKGCCYDNACGESFFHSLKVECIHGEHFTSRGIKRTTVFNYIECDYNRWHVTVPVAVSVRPSLKTRTSLRAVSTLRG